MDGVEIHEDDLLLRPWRREDADGVFRACQDPDIQRWTSVPRPYLREHAEGYVGPQTEQAWASATAAPFGVFSPDSPELLGACGLVTLDELTGMAEIGYWTAPWARARGVATRAARGVARWALQKLRLRRLLWRAEVGNHASRLVAARIGVQFEGLQRRSIVRGGGRLVDAWVGSLLPGELAESAPQTCARTGARAAAFARPPALVADTDRGETITLRLAGPRDLPEVIVACTDAASARWTTIPDPYTEADAAWFLDTFVPGCWARGDEAVFAVADADDVFAGSMSLRLIGDPTTTTTGDVGYLMSPRVRGRGYAPAALAALCEWGFSTLGLHRIEWRAYVGNEASKRVAEKAGFTMEGTVRAGLMQRGEFRDAWIGGLIARNSHDR